MKLKDNLKNRFFANNWEKGHISKVHILKVSAFISKQACILDCDKITEYYIDLNDYSFISFQINVITNHWVCITYLQFRFIVTHSNNVRVYCCYVGISWYNNKTPLLTKSSTLGFNL